MRSRRFWKGAGRVSATMLGTMVVFTGALAGLVFAIRPQMRRHKKTDLAVFDLLQQFTTPAHTELMQAVTKLGKHQFLIPANLSVIAWFLFVRKRTWFSVRIASIALSSLGLMFTFKSLFRRKRPDPPLVFHARGLSFPSGHAMMSVTFFGLLLYIASRTVKDRAVLLPIQVSFVTLILLIGFSRVYLRVHYASDVVAGFTIGLAWLLISLHLLAGIENYYREKGRLPAPLLEAAGSP